MTMGRDELDGARRDTTGASAGGVVEASGTFTPTATSNTGTITLSAASTGQWYTSGRLRWVSMTLVISSVSGLGASSSASFGGIPTPPFAAPTGRVALAVVADALGGSAGQPMGRISAGDAAVLFRLFRLTGGVLTPPGNTYIQAGTQLTLTGSWIE